MRKKVLHVLLLVVTFGTSVMARQQAAAARAGVRVIAVKSEAEAASIRTRPQAREVFQDLARKYSTDPSASTGGWLGVFMAADLRKEFQEALSDLRPNQVSGTVKVGGEYLLLQIVPDAEVHTLLGGSMVDEGKLNDA